MLASSQDLNLLPMDAIDDAHVGPGVGGGTGYGPGGHDA